MTTPSLSRAVPDLSALGRTLEEFGRHLQAQQPTEPDLFGYVDVDAVGLGAAARRAVRADQLRAFRVGRRLLVDREEFRRWVEQHCVGRPVAPPPAEVDDVDKVIEMNNRRRRA